MSPPAGHSGDPLHGLDRFAVRAKALDQHLDIDVEVPVTGGAAGMALSH
jgi:hypothetical protein